MKIFNVYKVCGSEILLYINEKEEKKISSFIIPTINVCNTRWNEHFLLFTIDGSIDK